MDGTFVAYARYSSTVLQYGQIKTTKQSVRLADVQTGVQTGLFLNTALICTSAVYTFDTIIKNNFILGTIDMVNGYKYMLTQHDETKDVFVSDYRVVWNSEE